MVGIQTYSLLCNDISWWSCIIIRSWNLARRIPVISVKWIWYSRRYTTNPTGILKSYGSGIHIMVETFTDASRAGFSGENIVRNSREPASWQPNVCGAWRIVGRPAYTHMCYTYSETELYLCTKLPTCFPRECVGDKLEIFTWIFFLLYRRINFLEYNVFWR